jgi:truncated hemoglobin YjbI
LQTIVDFWAQVTGGPQRYAGGMGRHVFLQLSPVHYEVWLAVWGRNCNEVLPPREASEMMVLAQDFGNRLQQMSAQHRNAQQQVHPDVTSKR